MDEWDEGDVTVTIPDGFRIVTGIVSGPFGIYFNEEQNHPGWVLTHIETGLSIYGQTPFKRIETAKEFASRIFSLTDWNEVDPDNPPNAQVETQEILEELLAREGQKALF